MNKLPPFKLINQAVRDRACTAIQCAPDNYECIIREHKPNRSLQQNARLHKIIGECAKESGYSIAAMKMEFKKELLAPIDHFDYKGRKCPVFKSTKDMKVKELNEFMERVEHLAAEWYSVRLPYQEER